MPEHSAKQQNKISIKESTQQGGFHNKENPHRGFPLLYPITGRSKRNRPKAVSYNPL